MKSPTFLLPCPKEEISSTSLAWSEYTHDKKIPADNQELKGQGNSASCQLDRETRRSWEQRPWRVKDTIPHFIRAKHNFFALDWQSNPYPERAIWLPIPRNFHDLVQIFKDYSVMPRFYRIPHVMEFPEFAGYHWMHRGQEQFDAEGFRRIMWEDQRIFRRIVFASCQTGRAPLCAPDYFYLPSEHRKIELYYLFRARNQILDMEWNSIKTKKPEENVDWRPFCEYIRSHLPTAEFLFEPPEVWDKTWFARKISETAEKIPMRVEIVDLVKAAGYEITRKKGWFGKESWSLADEEVIRRVALAHWIEWRETTEQDLERLGSHLIEL